MHLWSFFAPSRRTGQCVQLIRYNAVPRRRIMRTMLVQFDLAWIDKSARLTGIYLAGRIFARSKMDQGAPSRSIGVKEFIDDETIG